MKKIKDFFYDYNDVLVALLIVAVAGVLIAWRVGVVMDYPNRVAELGPEEETSIDVNFNGIDLDPENVEHQVDPEDEPETTGGAVVTQPETPPAVETKPAVEQKPENPPVNPKPQAGSFTLEVSKKNGSWQSVGAALEGAGVISSKSDFIKRVTERKVEASLQLGTFNFTTDMTLDQVIDVLIK